MEQNDIIEGHRLIAEFMELKPAGGSPVHYTKTGWDIWHVEQLRYHSSWDWLMPVLVVAKKKIAETGWGTPQEKNAKARLGAALNEVYNINIEAAYYCLIRFIEWYNYQQVKP